MSDNTHYTTEEEINKAIGELEAEGFFADENETLEKAAKADDDNEENEEATNAQMEGDAEKEGNGDEENEEKEDMEKGSDFQEIKLGKGTAYRKMIKGGGYADEKYYKKLDKGGYGEMSHSEVAGMFEANGGQESKVDDKVTGMTMQKGENSYEFGSDDIYKSLNDGINEVEESVARKFKAVGTIMKAQNEKIDALLEKFEDWSTQPQGRKSVGAKPVERFEKAEGGDAQVLSATANSKQVLDIMDSMAFAKGFDDEMATALQVFESSGELSDGVSARIYKETGVRIVE